MRTSPLGHPRAVRPAVLLLTILALGLGASALRSGWRNGRTVTSDDDPGVVHVHGLGLNPADGELVAATHTGLFTLRPGRVATRVADRYQDTMAFTVTGPDRFLGSGHPDLQEMELIPAGGRPLLGLIESVDAGESWQRLSLTGEVDFHSLVVAHGLVYGIDSTGGRLLVSADRMRWEVRSELEALDLAVSPSNPDRVLASDVSGLVGSSDGGRSFTPQAGPELAYLEWPSAPDLWGVSPQGSVQRSEDAGITWQERAPLGGEPEAFLATGDELFASLVDKGIVRSADGGRSWQLYYRNGGKVGARAD